MDNEKHQVECNMCSWSGYESDLVILTDEGPEDFMAACPNCKTDAYLKDIVL